MRPLCVEPDQVFHEDHIERLWLQKLVCVVVYKFLLDRSIESLTVCIHLRRFRIGVVVSQVKLIQPLCKVLLEFGTVVRENVFKRQGKDHLTESKEFFGSFGAMGGRAPCKAETAVNVFKGDDVPTVTVDEPFDRVKGNAVPWVRCFKVFGFSQHFLPIDFSWLAVMPDLLGKDAESSKVMDETTYRRSGWNGEILPTTEWHEQNL